jgi:hypothetical protein
MYIVLAALFSDGNENNYTKKESRKVQEHANIKHSSFTHSLHSLCLMSCCFGLQNVSLAAATRTFKEA